MKEADSRTSRRTYFFFNLGCHKNLVDADYSAAELERHGWTEVKDPSDAYLLVVTTCAFIQAAEQESVDEILRVASQKEDWQKLAVLGCLVSREGESLGPLLPEVDYFLPVERMTDLFALAGRETVDGPVAAAGGAAARSAQGAARGRRFTPPHLAYMKISEGCSNHCTYCTIPSIRGELSSRGADGIVKEAVELASLGVRELVVIAQDTAAWGRERETGCDFYGLVRRISDESGIEWIRLMYLHPAHIDPDRLAGLMESGLALRYADIPIQHANDRILRSMGRGYTREDLDSIFRDLRKRVEGIVLRTTVMAGFPGETEEEFLELVDFLQEHRIDHVGAFAFSPEEGTPAFGMDGRIDGATVTARVDEISSMQL
ncbi:MAG TPA: MiaB/RimO family radical SAM methylthiotransferase, partial [Candidatus Krumholzibacterium sp.]|nr:MiaB/RimO family radical SAM methylthiotransferase [Candidatus Krumholzibacterium sp.]